MKDGRPLRFLGAAVTGWTLVRIAILWPRAEPLRPFVRALVPPLVAAVLPAPMPMPMPIQVPLPMPPEARVSLSAARSPIHSVTARKPAPSARSDWIETEPALAAGDPATPQMPGILTAPLRPSPIARGPSRLAGSLWLVARGGPSGTLSGGQLGASQTGLRLTYALGRARRLALTARLAAPLQGPGKEAAIGVEWKPTRLPFRLIAEQRFAFDGGRGGPTAGIIGGYGPGDIMPGIRIEAYGQAGVIARDGVEGFVDTAARMTHPSAALGKARVDIGVGAWGSAQRGAARLDLGPTIGLAVPVAGKNLRLALDWRERLAGSARPGSGPAFTIGTDF